jgi:hypothetical protein
VTSVPPEFTRGIPEPPSPVANVSMALGVGLSRSLAHAGHDEGQVDEAVAVEGTGAQNVDVVEVAAQHVGAPVAGFVTGVRAC